MIQQYQPNVGTPGSFVIQPMSMALTMTGSRTDVAVILQVTGRVDGETAPELERTCHQWITPGGRNLILDFRELRYISSAGLSSILSAGKEIDRHGGRLLISGVSEKLKQTLMFCGFDTLFPVFDTTEDALTSCTREP